MRAIQRGPHPPPQPQTAHARPQPVIKRISPHPKDDTAFWTWKPAPAYSRSGKTTCITDLEYEIVTGTGPPTGDWTNIASGVPAINTPQIIEKLNDDDGSIKQKYTVRRAPPTLIGAQALAHTLTVPGRSRQAAAPRFHGQTHLPPPLPLA